MSTVGDNILLLRKELNWTQEELAKRMGYKSKSTINKIELDINTISYDKLLKLVELFNVDINYILDKNDEEDNKEHSNNNRCDDDDVDIIQLD